MRRRGAHKPRSAAAGEAAGAGVGAGSASMSPLALLLTMLAAAALGGGCYADSVWHRFTLDDLSAVQTNEDVLARTAAATVAAAWRNDFWGRPLASRASHKSYRPISVLSLRLDHWLAGSPSPPSPLPFHLCNVLLYALVCALVPLTAHRVLPPCAPWAIAGAALVFAAHPIHTEAVASIVGRAELLCAAFALTAANVYAALVRTAHAQQPSDAGAQREKQRADTSVAFPRHSGVSVAHHAALFVLAALLCVLSALSKESGVVVPPLLAAHDALSFLSRPGPARSRLGSVFAVAARTALLACVSLGYISARVALCGASTTPAPSFVDNPLIFAEPLPRAATAVIVQAYYVWLTVWPFRLSCDYGYDAIPVVKSLADLRLAAASLALVALAAATATAAGLLPRARRCLLLAAPYYALPLLPASHVVDIGTVVAERLLFLPTVGACFALAGLLDLVWHRCLQGRAAWRSAAATAALLAVVAVLAAAAHDSSSVWADNDSLMRNAAGNQPRSVKALLAHGSNIRRTDPLAAIDAHRRALSALPDGQQCLALHGLAEMLSQTPAAATSPSEMDELLTRALTECLSFAHICDVGRMLAMRNRLRDSRAAYYTCFESEVHSVTALREFAHVRNYGQVLYLLDDVREARKYYSAALGLISSGFAKASQNELRVIEMDIADIDRRLGGE